MPSRIKQNIKKWKHFVRKNEIKYRTVLCHMPSYMTGNGGEFAQRWRLEATKI